MFKKDKIIGFFKKNGFYICLALCLLGVGAAVLVGLGAQKAEEPEAEKEPVQTKQPISAPVRTQAPSAEEAGTVTVPSEQTDDGPADDEPVAAVRPGKAKVTLSMPLKGEIVRAYSGDTLVYNPTLNMWLTHNGIDIASKDTDEVTAALAGEVTGVESDETGAMTVEISHANGAKTVYAGLSEAGVEKGSLVNAGSPIGKAGTPAFEADLGKHLHFEYMLDGSYVDPAEHIK